MIKSFIDRLLGKRPKAAASKGGGAPKAKRVEVPKTEHGIDPALVDERAVKVVKTLADGGHEAYVVGGAVRDLLLGLRPKDFDVATDATPEQVKALFRRAFIIGRRFRIVHVVFGRGRQDRGLSEVIEVSTFRALMAPAVAEAEAGQGAAAPAAGAAGHVIDAAGRVLRDNVWGPQIEDAARRDFTVNAMYYDPQREIVVDYHGGIKDASKKLLRMIGDPETRYREDPVRIIRAIRFAAKLGFEIEPKTRAPIHAMAALLDSVPASRMFDEMIKLLQTGHALASLEELRKQGLHRGTFPILDVALDEAHRHDGHQKFVQLALQDTDRRVGEGKPVAPSFMLACLLWHDVLAEWDQLKARGEPAFAALQQAVEAVFDARIGDISGRGKLAGDMREIWLMQPRFERRTGNAPRSLVEQPRFRAGFDFLRLRATCGEADEALASWWEAFSLADEARRSELLDAARGQEPARRRGPRPSAPRAVAAPDAGAASTGRPLDPAEHPLSDEPARDDAPDTDADALLTADPAKKRRRRRRKPAERGRCRRGAGRRLRRTSPRLAVTAGGHADAARPADGVTPGTAQAFVGLGANLGEPRQALAAAIDALRSLPQTSGVVVSRCWRSAPIESNGPDYLNAVASLRTALMPHALLAELQRIERDHGRERPYRNAPRTLDLDLLLYGDHVIDSATLTLPHPRLHERAFVLRPLAELAPALVVPGRGPLQSLLPTVAGQRLQPAGSLLEGAA